MERRRDRRRFLTPFDLRDPVGQLLALERLAAGQAFGEAGAAGAQRAGAEQRVAQRGVHLVRDARGVLHSFSKPVQRPKSALAAALYYVLVEAVDEHPVHLLTLRGIRLEELVAPVAPAAGAAGPPRGEDAHGSGDGPPAEFGQ